MEVEEYRRAVARLTAWWVVQRVPLKVFILPHERLNICNRQIHNGYMHIFLLTVETAVTDQAIYRASSTSGQSHPRKLTPTTAFTFSSPTNNNMPMNKKSLNDYDEDNHQAMFESCRRVLQGWTKEKLESYCENINHFMTMLEMNKKEIMDFEKSSADEIEEAMKNLNETMEEFGNDMTMKQKRNHRQMKMELIEHKKSTLKEVEKLNHQNKRNFRFLKRMQKMKEKVKKAFNVVEKGLGMDVEK